MLNHRGLFKWSSFSIDLNENQIKKKNVLRRTSLAGNGENLCDEWKSLLDSEPQ